MLGKSIIIEVWVYQMVYNCHNCHNCHNSLFEFVMSMCGKIVPNWMWEDIIYYVNYLLILIQFILVITVITVITAITAIMAINARMANTLFPDATPHHAPKRC